MKHVVITDIHNNIVDKINLTYVFDILKNDKKEGNSPGTHAQIVYENHVDEFILNGLATCEKTGEMTFWYTFSKRIRI